MACNAIRRESLLFIKIHFENGIYELYKGKRSVSIGKSIVDFVMLWRWRGELMPDCPLRIESRQPAAASTTTTRCCMLIVPWRATIIRIWDEQPRGYPSTMNCLPRLTYLYTHLAAWALSRLTQMRNVASPNDGDIAFMKFTYRLYIFFSPSFILLPCCR